MDRRPRPRRRTKAHKNRSRPNPRNSRNHRPSKQVENRRPSPTIPKPKGIPRLPTPNKPIRLRVPHETSPGSKFIRRIRRPHQNVPRREIPSGIPRQTKNAPAPDRSRKVFPQDRPHRPLQRSNQARQFFLTRFPHPPMLAPGRRPFHLPPLRNHPRSKLRQAKRRHVPPPGLRRPHPWLSRTKTKGSSRTLPSSPKKCRKQICRHYIKRGCPTSRVLCEKWELRSRRSNGPHLRRPSGLREKSPERQNGSRGSHRHRP